MVLGNCFLDHCLTSLSSWTVSPFWATLNHFRPLWPKILASQQSPHFLWHPVMMRVMMVMRRTMMMVNTKKHLLHPSLLLLPPFSSHLPAWIFGQNIVKYSSTRMLNILICYLSIFQYSLIPSSHHIDNILIDPIPTKKDLILRAHFLNWPQTRTKMVPFWLATYSSSELVMDNIFRIPDLSFLYNKTKRLQLD